jgi:hypothetical protein
MGIVQRLATRLGSAHWPALVGRIAMGFCQVGWAVRNGANPLKGVPHDVCVEPNFAHDTTQNPLYGPVVAT